MTGELEGDGGVFLVCTSTQLVMPLAELGDRRKTRLRKANRNHHFGLRLIFTAILRVRMMIPPFLDKKI